MQNTINYVHKYMTNTEVANVLFKNVKFYEIRYDVTKVDGEYFTIL